MNVQRRRGFSLLEMLVSLAVLVIALLVVSNIFALTANTARSAVAISDVQTAMRSFLRTLEADLKGINTSESILILSGATQAAALTEEQRIANQFERTLVGDPEQVSARFDPVFDRAIDQQYSDPRTDILAFLTARPMPSRSPATGNITGSAPNARFQRAIQNGAKVAPGLVVYGHAAIAQPAGPTWDDSPAGDVTFAINAPAARDEISELPLTSWHLARRATLLQNRPVTGLSVVDIAPSNVGTAPRLEFLRGEPATLRAGDAADWSIEALLDVYNAGGAEVGSGFFPAATASPYQFPFQGIWSGVRQNLIWQMLYRQAGENPRRHVATVYNNPPPAMAGNLAVQGLPGCVWFQVEFLLPEDPRNAPDHPNQTLRDDQLRWVEIRPGETYVFVPDSTENRAAILAQTDGFSAPVTGLRLDTFAQILPPSVGGANSSQNRNVRTWPYAIRVTIKAYDQDGVLGSPLERTLTHRFR